jgi:hypothetical protein
MLKVAPATRHILGKAASLEMWGGATFDCALRFFTVNPPIEDLVRVAFAFSLSFEIQLPLLQISRPTSCVCCDDDGKCCNMQVSGVTHDPIPLRPS